MLLLLLLCVLLPLTSLYHAKKGAEGKGGSAVAALLLAAGADADAVDSAGRSAVSYAPIT